jgi:carbonic anhydrase/acetyltransferase-like protein (isoleucine patch superfamily)
MNKLLLMLKHLAREWLMACLASLPNDILSCRARRFVLLRLGFDLAPDALIYRHVLLLGKIQMGAGSSVSNNSCLNGASAGIRIGRHVMIAPNCCLVAFNHGTVLSGLPMIQQPLVQAPIVIKDDVWIGANCTITAGVTINSGAVVAANSVVTRDVGPNEIVGGAPARFIKHRTPAQHA